MPNYTFCCTSCNKEYDEMAGYDKTNVYPTVFCPSCGSGGKEKVATACRFMFADPVGTDRWNSETSGHDYRFKYQQPKIRAERQLAEKMSHMGATPYRDTSEQDFKLDTGIHDPETREGLS